ncbi:extracellular solute-binding protein [Paenibacillus eucommiae]|uniref:Aldouronate transport system substrate-binding protein n=1 Tax=Paenibacillus eucommiae TaxID=1355755 RepID=A0ABS4ITW9_9BACL|nr:extracellular solute-binding protein [Paenibacillus eucommiae]MBP1991020.1 putative aldouronate transport system substrate-binding protein [Paenibacillus eucommiae]
MKKWFIMPLFILLSMMLILAGCSKEEKGASGSSIAPSATQGSGTEHTEIEPKPGELPLSKELAELKIATMDNYYSPKSYTQNLPIWQEIEKRTNVKVAWNVFPAAQAKTVLDTMFAAGSNLPDIAFAVSDPDKLYKAGLIHDLKPFIEQFAPDMNNFFKEMPIVEALITEPTGEILKIPIVAMTGDYLPAYLIREDWLTKVGKSYPQTIDELVDVLKAFRDEDPNGNGLKDEISMALAPGFINLLASSFDVHPNYSFYPDAQGKIEYVPITDKYKVFLQFLNMLYREKLLDPSFASQTDDRFMSMINGDLAGVTVHYIANMRNWGMDKWSGFVYPKGPEGTQFVERIPPVSSVAVITKQSQNPQLAMKFLDYIMASEDGQLLANYGLEGVTYKLENGKPVFMDSVLKPSSDNPDPMRAIGSGWNLPRIQLKETVDAAVPEKVKKLNDEMNKYLVDPYPATEIPMTDEERELFNKGWSDMQTYQAEMMTKFIMGKADLNKDWDDYVKKVKDLGIEEKVQIEQTKYKRYNDIIQKNK